MHPNQHQVSSVEAGSQFHSISEPSSLTELTGLAGCSANGNNFDVLDNFYDDEDKDPNNEPESHDCETEDNNLLAAGANSGNEKDSCDTVSVNLTEKERSR